MSRRSVAITMDNVGDLPGRCRDCVFWELGPAYGAQRHDAATQKAAWVASTLLEWGSCGRIVYVDNEPAGYALYAPPAYVPRSAAFPTSPAGADSVLLMTAQILPQFAGGGLGRIVLQDVAKDLTQRGVKALEAFGTIAAFGAHRSDGPGCLLPSAYLRACGFATVRAHPHYPRLRLDLRTALSWRADVESRLDRLLGALAPEPSYRPSRP